MPAQTFGHYYLHIRSGNWQWRIEPNAIVELRHVITRQTVAEIPVALAVHALTHFVSGAKLTATFLDLSPLDRRPLASAPPRAALRPVGVPLRPTQQARADARRARRGRSKRTKGAA